MRCTRTVSSGSSPSTQRHAIKTLGIERTACLPSQAPEPAEVQVQFASLALNMQFSPMLVRTSALPSRRPAEVLVPGCPPPPGKTPQLSLPATSQEGIGLDTCSNLKKGSWRSLESTATLQVHETRILSSEGVMPASHAKSGRRPISRIARS